MRDKNIKKGYKDPSLWKNRLKDVPCFILGNSPSISDHDLSLLDDYFTIGINRIFYLYEPTILMWQDLALWVQEKNRILKTKSIKYCRQGAEQSGGFFAFKLNGPTPKLTSTPKMLYGRGSSGSIAYQLARSLGCNPISLVGMDCCYRKVNGVDKTDFYGNNPMHKPHTLTNCIKGAKFIKGSRGNITIYNCSENKELGEPMGIKEVIEKLGDRKYSREELEKILIDTK